MKDGPKRGRKDESGGEWWLGGVGHQGTTKIEEREARQKEDGIHSRSWLGMKEMEAPNGH